MSQNYEYDEIESKVALLVFFFMKKHRPLYTEFIFYVQETKSSYPQGTF